MNYRYISPALGAILAATTLATCYRSCPGATTPAPAAPTSPAATATSAASAASATPTTAAVATYSVNISPGWKAGLKFDYIGQDDSISPDGEVDIHFEAEGEVLALLPSGNPQKVAYTVKLVKVTGQDTPKTGIPAAGAKIVVEYAANNKKIVTVDGKPADPDAADFMDQVLWITVRNHTDQEIYGPKSPVAIGASWPVNGTAMADSHEEGDGQIDHVEGSMKLQSIDGTGDAQLATIAGNLTLNGKSSPDNPGSFSTKSTITASAPLNHHGVYKEVLDSTTTTTPPPSLASLLANGATTIRELTVQEIMVP